MFLTLDQNGAKLSIVPQRWPMGIAPRWAHLTWLASLAGLHLIGWCIGHAHAAYSVARVGAARPFVSAQAFATSSLPGVISPNASSEASVPIEILPVKAQHLELTPEGSVPLRESTRAAGPSTRSQSNPLSTRANATARMKRARELLAHGSIEQSCSEAKSAAELAPSLAEVWEFLGQCNMRLGRPDLARTYYRKFLELAPSSGRAPFIRAILETAA